MFPLYSTAVIIVPLTMTAKHMAFFLLVIQAALLVKLRIHTALLCCEAALFANITDTMVYERATGFELAEHNKIYSNKFLIATIEAEIGIHIPLQPTWTHVSTHESSTRFRCCTLPL